jgi:hypothetical protein
MQLYNRIVSFYKIDGRYIVRLLLNMNVRSMLALFKFSRQVKTPLGRWTFHDHRETSLKIKYANEDNCGMSCLTDPLDKNYIYRMGYESSTNRNGI